MASDSASIHDATCSPLVHIPESLNLELSIVSNCDTVFGIMSYLLESWLDTTDSANAEPLALSENQRAHESCAPPSSMHPRSLSGHPLQRAGAVDHATWLHVTTADLG